MVRRILAVMRIARSHAEVQNYNDFRVLRVKSHIASRIYHDETGRISTATDRKYTVGLTCRGAANGEEVISYCSMK